MKERMERNCGYSRGERYFFHKREGRKKRRDMRIIIGQGFEAAGGVGRGSRANFERTRGEGIYATASFIINIDTPYTCKRYIRDRSENGTEIAQKAGGAEKCAERTCNTQKKRNDQMTLS